MSEAENREEEPQTPPALPDVGAGESIGVDAAKPANARESPAGPYVSRAELDKVILQLQSDVERELVAREPRLIPTIVNLMRHFRPWRPRDPLVWASLRAFLWRVLSPSAIAIITTGVLGLGIAIYTALLLYKQNQKLDVQTYMMAIGSRLQLAQALDGETESLRRSLERRHLGEPATNTSYQPLVESISSRATPYRPIRTPGGHEERADALAREIDDALKGAWLARLSEAARALAPDDIVLERKPSSPERGKLLHILYMANNTVDSEMRQSIWRFLALLDYKKEHPFVEIASPDLFHYADLRDRRFEKAVFSDISLNYGMLRRTVWREMNLRAAGFFHADLSSACFFQSDLRDARFFHSNLAGASIVQSVLTGSSFDAAMLHRLHLDTVLVDADFLNFLSKYAQMFDPTGLRLRDATNAEADVWFGMTIDEIKRDGWKVVSHMGKPKAEHDACFGEWRDR